MAPQGSVKSIQLARNIDERDPTLMKSKQKYLTKITAVFTPAMLARATRIESLS